MQWNQQQTDKNLQTTLKPNTLYEQLYYLFNTQNLSNQFLAKPQPKCDNNPIMNTDEMQISDYKTDPIWNGWNTDQYWSKLNFNLSSQTNPNH